MKKLCEIFALLCLMSTYQMHAIHPRAESAVTSLQNRLQQLQIRYNPSLAENIQGTINLLRTYEPAMANKFQADLNELNAQQGQVSLSRVREPQPEPLPEVRPQRPAPTDAPPALPVTKPKPAVRPAPSDLPPALPKPSAPTDLPPALPTPLPPSDAPPALPQRPLPEKPLINPLRNQLTGMQQRGLAQLKYYVPTIEGLSVEDAQPLIQGSLKQLIRDFGLQNFRIKENTEQLATSQEQVVYAAWLPDIAVRTTTLASLQTAIKLYAILYGTRNSTPLRTYLSDIKNEFVELIFNNARARIKQINQILDQIDPFPQAVNPQSIHDTFRDFVALNCMVTELQLLNLPYIATFIASSNQNHTELTTEMRTLFDRLKGMLISIKNTFFMQDAAAETDQSLKIAQRNCYELFALVIQIYARSLIVPLPHTELTDLTNLIKKDFAQMTETLLKLRVNIKR